MHTIIGGVGIDYREEPDIFAKRPEDEADVDEASQEELEELAEDLEDPDDTA